ncbi:MAG: nucleotide exchange factor GrpE [bacterium]
MVKIPINSDSDDNGEAREGKEEGILEENNSEAASEEEMQEAAGEREAREDVDEVEKLRKQSEEYLDTLRRVQADFENYKKRVKRERADTIAFANEGIIRKLLGVVDNLDRGISCAEGEGGSEEDLLAGIKLVSKQFLDVLSDYGVEPFESAGQPFDPTRHECLYVLERDDLPDQTNVEELEKGFKMRDRVLRVAKVSVSKKPQAEDGGGEA